MYKIFKHTKLLDSSNVIPNFSFSILSKLLLALFFILFASMKQIMYFAYLRKAP